MHPNLKIFGVMGAPIAHSLSPTIHNHILQKQLVPAIYICLHAKNAQDIHFFFAQLNLQGANITSPLKTEAIKLANIINNSAIKAQVANCLIKNNNIYTAFNSDIEGISNSLTALSPITQKSKVLIIGAGGAALAALVAIAQHNPHICILNRNLAKAKYLAEKFGSDYDDLHKLSALLPKFTHVISTVPSNAFTTDILPKTWPKHINILDADYKTATLFNLAKKSGALAASGLDWLAYQAILPLQWFYQITSSAMEIKNIILNKPKIIYSRIALIGFMGCGKSTLLPYLAALLKYDLIDMDAALEQQFGCKTAKIFATYGEAKFRQAETDLLANLSQKQNIVIACGGGTATFAQNIEILQKHFYNIWIVADLEKSFAYCQTQQNRPLCTNNISSFKELFNERIKNYALTSNLVISNQWNNTNDILTTAQDLSYEISAILNP